MNASHFAHTRPSLQSLSVLQVGPNDFSVTRGGGGGGGADVPCFSSGSCWITTPSLLATWVKTLARAGYASVTVDSSANRTLTASIPFPSKGTFPWSSSID